MQGAGQDSFDGRTRPLGQAVRQHSALGAPSPTKATTKGIAASHAPLNRRAAANNAGTQGAARFLCSRGFRGLCPHRLTFA